MFLLKSSARSGGVSPEAASACDDAAAGAAAACGGAVAEAMRQPDAEDAAEARWPPDAEERWAQQLEAERLTRAAHLAELHARTSVGAPSRDGQGLPAGAMRLSLCLA
ncbi:unnamed protein product, partial [Prorocentrum cordatum]